MSDDETLKVYATQAARYAEITDDANAADPLLAAFIAALPKGGHVLDFGCGPGTAARIMAEAGLKITATDAVPEMVAMAARHPNVTATRATFDDIDGQNIYDGIWANFSLLHAPRADLPRHLSALHSALKPSGRFHIAMKAGTDSHRDKIGRFYTYVDADELRGLLESAGFGVDSVATGNGLGLDGTLSDWIALAAHA